MRGRVSTVGLGASLLAAGLAAGCGGSGAKARGHGAGAGTRRDASLAEASRDAGAGGDGGPVFASDGSGSPDANRALLEVLPTGKQTLAVRSGKPVPTLQLTATYGGKAVNPAWSVDRGEIGSVGKDGVFTPTGRVAGEVQVTATINGQTVTRTVLVTLEVSQSGPLAGEDTGSPGPGGVGGVGGEGLGGKVTAAQATALGKPAGTAASKHARLLYPYDATVWPRGLLAPLLQWAWDPGDAEAIAIHIETKSGSFKYDGTFGRPKLLPTGQPFIRHPIPQRAWDQATSSAGGTDTLVLRLTLASAGQAFGPLSVTWTVAPARLAGTVYYNSYGTQLVQNSIEPSFAGPQFGAAVLAIQGGDLGPSVVAGTTSPLGDGSGCRVCHEVAARGGSLIVQHGDNYDVTSRYDLKNGNAELPLTAYPNLFGWAALSPDGKLAFTNAANMAAQAQASQLYAMPPTSAQPIAAAGIPTNLQAGTPAFSPDGKHVAFDWINGTIGGRTGNGTELVALDFDGKKTFSNLQVLNTMPAGKDYRAGFPSFLPSNDAVVFHYETVHADHRYDTWHGARAQIWWSDLATGTAHALDALNGIGKTGVRYIPDGPDGHDDDTTLSYEPTVSPVSSGGFAWIIFTSRRLYGNVATGDPFRSDPRDYDATLEANTTTKKLWVAAIDLSPKAGTDPSHPAFYLPAQEILAGNSRGFWVLEPCRPDGASCMTGDQCCAGYCQAGGDGGALTCGKKQNTPSCSQPQERCTTGADCCDATNVCVGGFCALEPAR